MEEKFNGKSKSRHIKKTKDSFAELKVDYNDILNRYFPDDLWNCNYDFFSDFSYSANSLYCRTIELQQEIDSMVKMLKFELVETEIDYQRIRCECEEIQCDIKQRFDEVLEQIQYSGGLSDAEQETLEQLQIY